MKRLSKLLLLLLVPMLVQAQTEWTEVEPPRSYKYDGTFASIGFAHGITADGQGRIWACGFGSANQGIYIYEQDGTPVDTVKTVTVDGTTIPSKTQCRGLETDHDGNVLAVMNSINLMQIDHQTLEGMALHTFDASHAKPGVDGDGFVYTARVVPPSGAETTDVQILDSGRGMEIDATASVAPAMLTRALAAAGDGLAFYVGRLGEEGGVYEFTSEDALTYVPGDTMSFFDGDVSAVNWGPDSLLWASDEGQFPDDVEFSTRNYKVIDLKDKTYWTFQSDSLGLRPRGVWVSPGQDTLLFVSAGDGLIQRFIEGEEGTPITDVNVPAEVTLAKNYPNPFSGSTRFAYDLTAPAKVELAVYDVLGRRVQTLLAPTLRTAGTHHADWDGTNADGRPLANGTYFFVLTVDGQRLTHPAVLLR